MSATQSLIRRTGRAGRVAVIIGLSACGGDCGAKLEWIIAKLILGAQGRKLIAIIGTAAASLRQIDTIVPAYNNLADATSTTASKDANYGAVGSALLWTLERGSGNAYMPPVREPWTACYVAVADVMKDAARSTF